MYAGRAVTVAGMNINFPFKTCFNYVQAGIVYIRTRVASQTSHMPTIYVERVAFYGSRCQLALPLAGSRSRLSLVALVAAVTSATLAGPLVGKRLNQPAVLVEALPFHMMSTIWTYIYNMCVRMVLVQTMRLLGPGKQMPNVETSCERCHTAGWCPTLLTRCPTLFTGCPTLFTGCPTLFTQCPTLFTG